jgi:hypothetical protein
MATFPSPAMSAKSGLVKKSEDIRHDSLIQLMAQL